MAIEDRSSSHQPHQQKEDATSPPCGAFPPCGVAPVTLEAWLLPVETCHQRNNMFACSWCFGLFFSPFRKVFRCFSLVLGASNTLSNRKWNCTSVFICLDSWGSETKKYVYKGLNSSDQPMGFAAPLGSHHGLLPPFWLLRFGFPPNLNAQTKEDQQRRLAPKVSRG